MTFLRLLLRNLRFHWRGNFAVFLGVAVGTAVLTGALLVGDSLRGSLREVTERQLGWVDSSMVTGRFFRQELAHDLVSSSRTTTVLPVIALQASAEASHKSGAGESSLIRRAGRVNVWGIPDEEFWERYTSLTDTSASQGLEDMLVNLFKRRRRAVSENAVPPDTKGLVLNAALAQELGVRGGDKVILSLPLASETPRESLLGRRDKSDVLTDVELSVASVLPDDHPAAVFSLNPSPVSPRNAFVDLKLLQDKLKVGQRVNALLVKGPPKPSSDDPHAAKGERKVLGVWVQGPTASPTEALRQSLTLDDWGLVVQDPEHRTNTLFDKLDKNKDGKLSRAEWRNRIPRALAEEAFNDGDLPRQFVLEYYRRRGYLSLESKQMLLEPAVADAALKVAKDLKWTAAPTLVYLANTIKEGDREIPYSVVAALDPALPAPLGPFLPPDVKTLKDDEIVLAGWKDSPLPGKVGDQITLTYFQPEEQGKLGQRSHNFRLAGVLPLTGVADDPDLTPEFPGITDKLSLKDWNPPFPYDNSRVKKPDEEYWNEYRTTPKAYVTLKAGQDLWHSRFGSLTSIRLAPPKGQNLTDAAAEFRRRLLAELKPERGGFVFDPVRERSLEAGERGGEFGFLFLGFSFFLIAAALLLVGLLFRLNLDRRAAEIGLLLAAGFRTRTVRRLLLAEGGIVAALGGLLGTIGAIGYAWLLLEMLRSWWPGSLDRSFLSLHITPLSLAIGYVASVIVSLCTIAWAVRILGRIAPSALLSGAEASQEAAGPAKPARWSKRIAVGGLIGGLALIPMGAFVHDHEAQAGTFFTGGALLLTAGLAAVGVLLRRESPAATQPNIAALGVRNAARNPTRSLLTAGLLASAAFLIVVVESFRREPDRDFLNENAGSGGFSLLAESDVPIFQDLNSDTGRDEILDELKRRNINADALKDVSFYPFRLRAGDDASCLNLYQPGRPRILGVPQSLIKRGGFQFADTVADKPDDKKNPWLLLEQPTAGDAIPVFGEKNTVEWMLKKSLGGVVKVPNERGEQVELRIVGLLQDSVFQGELLMSEANFHKLYPSQEGYSYFLIAAPAERSDKVKELLETGLASHGFLVTPTAQRLEAYLAVENTYLSTFQALGGLGLLLGALGLAVVLLRSAWERRGELALMRALGFRRQTLGWLVLAENGFLLLLGLGVGAGSALLAVAPQTFGSGATVPWLRLLGLLGLVLIVGLAAGASAMRATLRAPLLPALRRE